MSAPSFEDVTPILSVADLPAALDWYANALGFAVAWRWGEPVELASVCRGRVELNLAQRGKLGPPGPSRVYVRAEPIDAVWEIALASGAEVLAPIADRAYGMRDFAIRDASGNVLDFGAPVRTGAAAAPGAPAAEAMKVFVPAKDFARSRAFYAALGFAQNWESPGLCELQLGADRFLLQDFYVADWADNFMIHIETADADAWDRHARAAIGSGDFPGARVEGPRNEPWGYRVAYVVDPSGVLLRFSQPLARP